MENKRHLIFLTEARVESLHSGHIPNNADERVVGFLPLTTLMNDVEWSNSTLHGKPFCSYFISLENLLKCLHIIFPSV